MLHITQPAAQHMRTMLSRPCRHRGNAVRVMARENCLEVIRDQQRPGDVMLFDDDDVLVVVDRATASWLADCEIDYDQSIARLVFTDPAGVNIGCPQTRGRN